MWPFRGPHYGFCRLPSMCVRSSKTKKTYKELTWLAGYTPRWFTRLLTVTHPNTNRLDLIFDIYLLTDSEVTLVCQFHR